jgi:hypothetical protein
MNDPFKDTRDPLVQTMERNDHERLIKCHKEAVKLIRRYYWCESRVEGRRIDEAAGRFLDKHGGREVDD